MIKALEPIQDRNVDLEITAYGEPFTHPKCDDYMFLSRKMAPKAKIMFVSNNSLQNRVFEREFNDKSSFSIRIQLKIKFKYIDLQL